MEIKEYRIVEEKLKEGTNEGDPEESLADRLFPEKAEFMPDKIKKEYENFVLKVKDVNPEISEEQVVVKIFKIEENMIIHFFGCNTTRQERVNW